MPSHVLMSSARISLLSLALPFSGFQWQSAPHLLWALASSLQLSPSVFVRVPDFGSFFALFLRIVLLHKACCRIHRRHGQFLSLMWLFRLCHFHFRDECSFSCRFYAWYVLDASEFFWNPLYHVLSFCSFSVADALLILLLTSLSFCLSPFVMLLLVGGWYLATGQYFSLCETAVVSSLDAVGIGEKVLVRVQVECGREEVNNGEKQEKDRTRTQPTDNHTHIVDGMKMEWVRATQTHWAARLEPCSEYAHLIVCESAWERWRVKCICHTCRRLQWITIDCKRNPL